MDKRTIGNILSWGAIIIGGICGIGSKIFLQQAAEEDRQREIALMEKKMNERLDEDVCDIVERSLKRKREAREKENQNG